MNQSELVKALHKLPYIENNLHRCNEGSPAEWIVNEPVRRVEQVVVLSQAEYPCQHPPSRDGVDDLCVGHRCQDGTLAAGSSTRRARVTVTYFDPGAWLTIAELGELRCRFGSDRGRY